MFHTSLSLITPLLFTTVAQAASSAEWRGKSIYQVLTDRFALPDGSTDTPCDAAASQYCGGTWSGIVDRLDYIQGMGFTAIWISPIIKNVDNKGAFHGYWPVDLYELNTNFGTKEDLIALAEELHSRGMFLMVDITPNHFSWMGSHDTVDYSTFTPFDSEEYFHPWCWITDDTNQTALETCWIGNDEGALVDVRTELDSVRQTYNSWGRDLISNYSIDGFRIDTAKFVEKDFWTSFQSAVDVYSVGEVFNGDHRYTCPYQDVLPGVLNFPVYFPLIRAFQNSSGSVEELVEMIGNVADTCKDSTLLGSFTENHDIPRFASYTKDQALAKNVLAFNILADGIPIVYQGAEQGYDGAKDPVNREAVWLSGYNTEAALYRHVASLNAVRNHAVYLLADEYLTDTNRVVTSGDNWMAMRKGKDGSAVVTVLTNAGAEGAAQTVGVTETGYAQGVELVDVIGCESVEVGEDGKVSVEMEEGVPRVFWGKEFLNGTALCGL